MRRRRVGVVAAAAAALVLVGALVPQLVDNAKDDRSVIADDDKGRLTPPGNVFPLVDLGPATDIGAAHIGLPVVQQLTRTIEVRGRQRLTIFTALTIRFGGETVGPVRCVTRGGGGGCADVADDTPDISQFVPFDDGRPDRNLWVWKNVPDEVDHVTYVDGDDRYWQRPVAGVVVFPDIEGYDEVAIAYGRDGAEVARSTDRRPRSADDPASPSRWADISKTQYEHLRQVVQQALGDCLTRHGAEPLTPELVTLPAGTSVEATWEMCASEAGAVYQARLAAMDVRFFDPATEEPQSDDPAFVPGGVVETGPDAPR